MSIVIQIANDEDPRPEETQLQAWAKYALENEPHGVTLRVVTEAEIQDLNLNYRGKDKPTNVLAFPFEAPPKFPRETLGDVILCASVINREADEQHKTKA